jgi:hypothetical protein
VVNITKTLIGLDCTYNTTVPSPPLAVGHPAPLVPAPPACHSPWRTARQPSTLGCRAPGHDGTEHCRSTPQRPFTPPARPVASTPTAPPQAAVRSASPLAAATGGSPLPNGSRPTAPPLNWPRIPQAESTPGSFPHRHGRQRKLRVLGSSYRLPAPINRGRCSLPRLAPPQ